VVFPDSHMPGALHPFWLITYIRTFFGDQTSPYADNLAIWITCSENCPEGP